MRAVFNKYDRSGQGKLDKQAFADMTHELGYYFSPEQLEVAWALLDSDHSGSIEFPEWQRFWREDERFARLQLDDAQLAKVRQISEFFRYYDVDRDGSLSRAEFAKLAAQMESTGYNLKLMGFSFDLLDKDGDGAIEFNEFVDYLIDTGALDRADGTRPVHT